MYFEFAFLRWVNSILFIFDNLIVFFTFGFYNPPFGFNFLCWRARRHHLAEMNRDDVRKLME